MCVFVCVCVNVCTYNCVCVYVCTYNLCRRTHRLERGAAEPVGEEETGHDHLRLRVVVDELGHLPAVPPPWHRAHVPRSAPTLPTAAKGLATGRLGL